MKRVRKMVGALLGGATAAGVATVLAVAGVEVEPAVAAALATLAGAVGAWLAPPNEPTPER